MRVQTNPRFQSLRGSLGLIMLLSTLAISLPQLKFVKVADATKPPPRGSLEVGVRAGPERIAPALGVDGVDGNEGSEPWTSSQVQQPVEFAKEVADPKSKKPLIIYVGFPFLYQGGRIPGALLHGPTAKPEGLEELKKWSQNLPRSQPIVIYCGCCPWNRCPNIRPAFKTLQELGFTKLKILFLQTDFTTDWLQKGFPVQKGT